MKINCAEHSLKAGIYKIANTYTGGVYIGQASRFKKQRKAHERPLLIGRQSTHKGCKLAAKDSK